MRIRFLVLIAIAAMVGTAAVRVGVAAAAVPGTVTLADPAGDVPNPAGDILSSSVTVTPVATTFSMTIKAPGDPLTDPNWTSGRSGAGWTIDTGVAGSLSVVASLHAYRGTWSAVILLANNVHPVTACHGTGARHGSTLVARFGIDCNTGSFRWSPALLYNDGTHSQTDSSEPQGSPVTPSVRAGYELIGSDGTSARFGNAPLFSGEVPHTTAAAMRRAGDGEWIVDSTGHVFTRGRARYKGGAPALRAGETITTIAVTPSERGYWLFSNVGRAFAFGDAQFHGDLHTKALNADVVGSVATPSGKGYYMIGSDGGVFAFGDARFRGSMGGKRLNAPVVGIARTATARGIGSRLRTAACSRSTLRSVARWADGH